MKLFTFFLFLIASIPGAHAIDEKSPQGYFVLFSESGSTITHYGCFIDENNKSKLRCDVQDVYIDKGKGEDFSQVRSNPEFKKMFDEAGSFKDEYADEFRGVLGQMCPLIPIWNKVMTDPSQLNIDGLIRELDTARFPDFDVAQRSVFLRHFQIQCIVDAKSFYDHLISLSSPSSVEDKRCGFDLVISRQCMQRLGATIR